MRRIITIAFLMFVMSVFALEPHFMTDPTISPDGATICFVYENDLWTVPYTGGEAHRLTTGDAAEWEPRYSPDGSTIAFVSNRSGWTALYSIPSSGGSATLISAAGYGLCDWFPDGKSLLVRLYKTGKSYGFYRLSIDGEAQEITFINAQNAVLNGDGTEIIYNQRGSETRERYTGSHNGDLWIYSITDDTFTRLTRTDLSEYFPQFSHTRPGQIYFSASDGSVAQLVSASSQDASDRTQLTDFDQWSVRHLAIARANDRMVFEKFDELWRYDPAQGDAQKIEIVIAEDIPHRFDNRLTVQNSFENYSVSDDGKLVAFSYKFDLFAIPEEGGEVVQITSNQAGIRDIEILSDNKTILFSMLEDGQPHLYSVNILDPAEIKPVKWARDKYIERITVQDNVVMINYSLLERKHYLAVGDESLKKFDVLYTDLFVSDAPALSPDGRYLLVVDVRQDVWTNTLHIYDLEEKQDHVVYRYNGGIDSVAWGEDGLSAFFTRSSSICRIDLQPRDDFFSEEDHWDDILKNEGKDKDSTEDSKEEKDKDASGVEVCIDFDSIELRVHPVIKRLGRNYIAQVINDSTFYYLNYVDDTCILRKSDYENKSDKRITEIPEDHKELRYNKQNKSFYFVDNKKLKKLNPSSKKTELVKNTFKYRYDSFQLNQDVFRQAWVEFGRGFYDPDMHGIDWKESYKRFAPYMKYATNPAIMGTIYREMMGEVNASHTGFYARRDTRFTTWGKAEIGATFDLKNRPSKGVALDDVYRKSQLFATFGIRSGDILLAVDGVEITRDSDITPLFIDKQDQKIRLKILHDDEEMDVEIKGLNWGQNYSLYYDNWVEERRAMVEKIAPQLGYAHIRSMNWSSYDTFIQDIFARNFDKEGLIIDVRNNGGGYIHDWLVEALTKKQYAYSTRRSFDASRLKSPGNIWDKPLILLINEGSFSDAEIFPNLFRYLGLGKIVGTPTSGSVIGTGHTYFMDGSSMRMPMTGWYLPDGTNMEGNGVQPDILVEPTPKQIINDDDIQLKRAIEEILKEI